MIQKTKSVLVVDDDPICRELTAAIFMDSGCEVKIARDGIEALNILKDYSPDLITIDLIMPYLKGDRLCKIIREMDQLDKTRLVVISGVANEACLDPADLGADACIAKDDPHYHKILTNFLYIENRSHTPAFPSQITEQETDSKHTATKELFASQHRLEIILQNMVDPLFEFTQEGIIVYANQSAVTLAGLPEHKLLNSNFLNLFSTAGARLIRSRLAIMKQAPVEINEDKPLLINHQLVAGWLVPFVLDEDQTIIAMLHDITARKDIEAALKRSRASFHDIVEKNIDGILVLDEKNERVHYANTMAGIFLEREAKALADLPFSLPATQNLPVEIDILRPATNDRGVAELRSVQTRWDNHPARLVTLTDISSRKQLERRLTKAKLEAEQASEAKSQFLANMSHELRSPLNALLLLARDLIVNKEETLTPDQIESAELIHSSGMLLLNLINSVLDVTKIEAGRMEINTSKISLSDLAKHIGSFCRPLTEDKGLSLSITIDKSLPDIIYTDHQKLEQILRNLISNGIKFTSEGNIIVEFFRPQPDLNLPPKLLQAKAIGIAVTDTGIGIPAESQEGVFEAFTQADGSTSRRFGGTGLGLSISRNLANLLGGDIQLVSKEGKGSTFTLYIPENIETAPHIQTAGGPKIHPINEDPVINREARDQGAKPAAEIQQWSTEKNILVVDDQARNLFSIARILESYGMCVSKAIDGRKALSRLQNKPDVDLILMDMKMPELDGYEAIRRIRKMKLYAKLPIIALTAKAMKGDREKCLSAGADDYLSKPVDIEQLLAKMKQHLS